MKRTYNIITLLIACLLLSSCTKAEQPRPFEYRALYTPTNLDAKEWGLKGTNNVDNDWSLWGHNIWKVLGENPPQDVYALIDGKRDTTQYCFSSKHLYESLENWIIDQWGTEGGRFTVMPADNKKVCQCEECQRKGNTIDSATPAVADVLRRLAKRFPKHQFFMTAYHSTKQPPKDKLPENAGVMLSTIDIPMRWDFRENKGFKKFDDMLEAWRMVTPLIYVWDYGRNFDDYLSPYPCLFCMQQRLKYYQERGITGVFVNGSGEDYSTFDDVQTFVLAQLMMDVNTDVEKAVRQFYERFYPELGGIIADYYMKLEFRVRDSNHIIPFYGTIEEEEEAYLDKEEFENFWKKLDKASKGIEGEERQRINRMLTALCYTRLMMHPTEEEKEDIVIMLKDYKSVPRLANYKETKGSLEDLMRKYK